MFRYSIKKIKSRLSPLIELTRGLTSYLPGFGHPIFTRTGGTNSARYCYAVWMRHLVKAKENGLAASLPSLVAELGPGDSLGMGLAALLSGSEKYFAFDVVRYANPAKNLTIYSELIDLFRNRASIPDEKEFPLVKPYLSTYDFPSIILTDTILEKSLSTERLENIRASILSPEKTGSMIVYQVPWNDSAVIQENSVDMIFSQATLEHVDEIEDCYRIMHDWLKPSGFMSHQIDLKCHGTSNHWNGHWQYSDRMWKIIRGKRQWLLNRLTCSQHLRLLKKNRFEIVYTKTVTSKSQLNRKSLDKKFISISDMDLETSGLFFLATKY